MRISRAIGVFRFYLIDLVRGTRIIKVLKELRVQQYLQKKEIEQIREKRFDELFKRAQQSTVFYRKYPTYEDLPVLTKDRIRENISDFISTNYSGKLHRKGTGGSTGTPLVYYTTANAQSFMWAGIILSWEVAGYQFGDKVAFVAGTSLFKSDFKHQVFHHLMNIDSYSTFTLNDENILDYINRLKNTKTKIIYCYATALDIIATYINNNEPVSFPHLKGIVSSAEVLTEVVRANIEKAFKVKVFNQYGCNEAGISAFECEHKKMHMIDTRSKYELDENGNLISTDLANEGFIIMKYFTGDMIEFSAESVCECNRNFTIIKKVIGRSYDIVTDMNHKILHAAFFNILFRQDESIRQFQVLFDKETITIHLNVEHSKNESDYDKYMEVIKKHLKFKEYKLIINSPFLKSKNAKHRYVIDISKG